MANWFKEHLGDDEKPKKILLCCLGEFIGNVFINFFACMSILGQQNYALTYGLVVAVLVQVFGPLSGGYFNPAVTIGMYIGEKVPLIRGSLYFLSQILGSLVGTALIMVLPKEMQGNFGMNLLAVAGWQGAVIELLLGFLLMIVYLGVNDEKNNANAKIPGPFIIGVTITISVFAAASFTSGGINPARSIGSAVLAGAFNEVWVFTVGPIIGGILGAFLYKYVIASAIEDEGVGDEG